MATLASLITMADLSKRQNPIPAPIPQGHFGRDRWYAPRWAMILSAVLAGIFVVSICACILVTVFRRRKSGTSTAEIKRAIAHQRRMSGIVDEDPDNIKPVKRLRSFHMKGAVASPDATSPRTPKGANAGLFSRFFRKKDGKRLPPLDEERNESYSSLNSYPETPALDEKMLEASPPPTPAPAFGWSSNVGPGPQQRGSIDQGPPAPPYYPGVGEQNTAYKGDVRPPAGQRESDSFLQTGTGKTSRDAKRLSTDYNENYQTRPSGGLFDDDEDERRPLGYNPDSRSGN
ncbi:hypothetical protein TWF225_009186 [Orbilia oligospora]|uniref:Uncharacterized protein n=1 Tax=Orbilia oligospora TaxID=2813651 RepID=A0A7C8PF93_ORBOL|nr:hypothetical protein TWF751_003754 [Orbilia oligospora]KAF3193618.1 hypothetical protein TWF225_009186 [Orbilia oligospora]KAF3239965.1 hypothetical protein TWF128_011452 [Orbilia oligospora]KAF3265868.1 hypothetical protein TWF217_002392 [Orbilia oligospora]KAF3276746.1 hypothetical protein TWF132_001877 [Orbilia oligospora]